MKPDLSIIFMGTPDFAVPALEALAGRGYRIPLVVTQPDRPRGRGRKTVPTPVKASALALGLDVIQPAAIRGPAFLEQLGRHRPDVLVVAAYGKILPPPVLSLAPMGAVNLHASLLPKYRGAAPIQWAVINREQQTGITTMQMDEGLDTGDILQMAAIDIAPRETAATLHDRLKLLAADLLLQTLEGLAKGEIQPRPQDGRQATHAPLLTKSDGRIDWQKPAPEIEALVRGMVPWPGAFTFWEEKRVKIFQADIAAAPPDAAPGTVLPGFAGELKVGAGEGAVLIRELQLASGKRLGTEEFLRGCPVPAGTVFT